jgi:hypothetical protein
LGSFVESGGKNHSSSAEIPCSRTAIGIFKFTVTNTAKSAFSLRFYRFEPLQLDPQNQSNPVCVMKTKTRPIIKALALLALSAFNLQLSTVSLTAGVLTVTSLANSGPGSLRDTVTASFPGDTIVFSINGTIVLNSAIVINHTLFVQGPGAAKLTVSGNFVDRVFVTSGTPVVLSGMTIRDGLLAGPPGIDGGLCQDGTAGGSAQGGAIAAGINSSDRLILSNCWLTGNTAWGGQGGRGGDGGTPVCVAAKGGMGGFASGGALYVLAGSATAFNCSFSDNHVIGGRGGDGGNNLGQPTAAGAGGAGGDGEGGGADVSLSSISPGFTNCTFSGNSALGGAGGAGGTNIVAFPGGNGGNGGSGSCGALYTFTFDIISCTVVSNNATGGAAGNGGSGVPFGINGTTGPGYTGGICGYIITCGGGAKMGNTIVADNLASTSLSNLNVTLNDLGFNYFGDDQYMPCAGPLSRIGTVAAPLHPQLGPLAQNGGGLPTHAPLQGSPVIDWGNSFGTLIDERHAPRPVGSPQISAGDGSDIGAFEFGSTPLGMSTGGTNGTQVLITWPAYYGDFTLQSSSNLFAPGSWAGVTDKPTVVGDLFVVTNTPTGVIRFYRLISH